MPRRSTKAVVITGDIVRSSHLRTEERRKLLRLLKKFFTQTSAVFPDFKAEQFRGDSIQAIFSVHRTEALRTSLSLLTQLMSVKFKIRLSIGAGEISFTGSNIITSDGSAFRLSGTLLDELKKRNEYFGVTGTDAEFQKEWEVHNATLNYLIGRWSTEQAQAIHLQLQNLTQEEIGRKLKVSQPSIHQRLQIAGWPVINIILQRFEKTIPSL